LTATARPGQITLRARADIDYEKHQIIIKEVPISRRANRLHEAIGELVKDERGQGHQRRARLFQCPRRPSVNLTVSLKRDADAELVLSQLYQFSPLQKTVSFIMLALVDDQPRLLNIKQIMEEFIRHRVGVNPAADRFPPARGQAPQPYSRRSADRDFLAG